MINIALTYFKFRFLRRALIARMPRVDLPEILLEIAARCGSNHQSVRGVDGRSLQYRP
ncbi:MAG: hypothetical protein VB142_11410 [Burkholderia sp.]